jgi:DNA-binding transcriptional LysR family regulator
VELFREEVVPVCAPELLAGRTLGDAAELADLVLLQSTSRPEAWHEWFQEQGLQSVNAYHGPRFDTFYMALSAAQAGCGVALVRYLAAKELAEGAWWCRGTMRCAVPERITWRMPSMRRRCPR